MPARLLPLLAILCCANSALAAEHRAGFAEAEITPQRADTLSLIGGGTGEAHIHAAINGLQVLAEPPASE